jgi:hypothetical protein
MSLPKKCLVDTNVPMNANLANDPANIPDELAACVQECVSAIDHVMKKRGFVIDSGDEIYGEYLNNLSLGGRKGIGNAFMKWVHDNRWLLPDSDRVTITRNGDSYDEFPTHDDLHDFDKSDQKFVAVANAHADKPPILQATDSKWWGWKDALSEVGIGVQFLCPEYVEAKYAEKMGT